MSENRQGNNLFLRKIDGRSSDIEKGNSSMLDSIIDDSSSDNIDTDTERMESTTNNQDEEVLNSTPAKMIPVLSQKRDTIKESDKNWLPLHYLIRNKNPCWTHFLALDKRILYGKCKHCGFLIERSTTANNKISIKNFRGHLQMRHRIQPRENYYTKVNRDTKNKFLRESINSSQNVIESGIHAGRNISTDLTHDGLIMMKSKTKDFPKVDLLALMCATQNFPISFINLDIFSSMFQSLKLSTHISPEDILDKICEYSDLINKLFQKSISKYSNELNFQLNSKDLAGSQDEKDDVLANFINISLIQLLEVPLLSLSQHMYMDKFFIISAHYVDQTIFNQKCFPLTIIPLHSKILDLPNFIETQLLNCFERDDGLKETVLSVTIPKCTSLTRSHLVGINEEHSDLKFHNCFVSNLVGAIQPFFGYSKQEPVENKAQTQLANYNTIDSIVDLSCIDIDTSIFGKINAFHQELTTDKSQIKKFDQICKDCNKILYSKKLTFFNMEFPSTAIKFLRTFSYYKKEIISINKFLYEETFTESDFEVASNTADILSSTYVLIDLFSSSASNFQNIFITLVTIESYITDLMGSIITPRLIKPLGKYLETIADFKRNFILDDDAVLATLLSPTTMFNNDLLCKIFDTASVTDITDKMVDISLKVLKRFLKTKLDKESIKSIDKVTTMDGWELYDHLPFTDFNNQVDSDKPALNIEETLDAVLLSQIRNDINDYLNVIRIDYNNFFKTELAKSPYVRKGKKFINLQKNRTLNPMAELIRIHLPISNSFMKNYLDLDSSVVFSFLVKYILTQSASSFKSNLSFLSHFDPANKETILSEIISVRIFTEQFQTTTIIWEDDDLLTICEFPEINDQ